MSTKIPKITHQVAKTSRYVFICNFRLVCVLRPPVLLRVLRSILGSLCSLCWFFSAFSPSLFSLPSSLTWPNQCLRRSHQDSDDLHLCNIRWWFSSKSLIKGRVFMLLELSSPLGVMWMVGWVSSHHPSEPCLVIALVFQTTLFMNLFVQTRWPWWHHWGLGGFCFLWISRCSHAVSHQKVSAALGHSELEHPHRPPEVVLSCTSLWTGEEDGRRTSRFTESVC